METNKFPRWRPYRAKTNHHWYGNRTLIFFSPSITGTVPGDRIYRFGSIVVTDLCRPPAWPRSEGKAKYLICDEASYTLWPSLLPKPIPFQLYEKISRQTSNYRFLWAHRETVTEPLTFIISYNPGDSHSLDSVPDCIQLENHNLAAEYKSNGANELTFLYIWCILKSWWNDSIGRNHHYI